MAQTNLSDDALKKVVKEALVEALQEQRELLHTLLLEALEDFSLAEAIREGQETRSVSREEVLRTLGATP
jgi:ribosomal protein L12E/L44/L45/RPP1/RPP2